MAICDYCNKEMIDPETTSCVDPNIELCDKTFNRIPYGSEVDKVAWVEAVRKHPAKDRPSLSSFKRVNLAPEQRCHDCNVAIGGLHHPGCDVEECPRCHWQMISCPCAEECAEGE